MQPASAPPPATAPSAPPPTVSVRVPGPDGTERVITAAPADAYRGAVRQRDEIRDQLDTVEDRRDDVAQEIAQTSNRTDGGQADLAGLKSRLAELDGQIVALERLLAVANDRVAQLAGVPGAIVEVPRPPRDRTPEIAAIGIVGTCVLLFPVALAWARRLWKQAGQPPAPGVPRELVERVGRMEQALDTVAIEVERMSEAQRYLTRVLTEDGRALGAGAAKPVEMSVKETVGAPRVP